MGLTLNQLMQHIIDKTPFMAYGDPIIFDPAIESSHMPHEWYRDRLAHGQIAVNIDELRDGEASIPVEAHDRVVSQLNDIITDVRGTNRSLLSQLDAARQQLSDHDTVCQSAGACYLKLHANRQRTVGDVVDAIVVSLAEAGLEVNAAQARVIESALIADRSSITGLQEDA